MIRVATITCVAKYSKTNDMTFYHFSLITIRHPLTTHAAHSSLVLVVVFVLVVIPPMLKIDSGC